MAGVPLLFTSPGEQPAFDYTRGRGAGTAYDGGLTPPSQGVFGGGGGVGTGGTAGAAGAGGAGGASARRRSLTATPGSAAAADPSPLRPPPIMRLNDALMSDGDLPLMGGGGAAAGGGQQAAGGPLSLRVAAGGGIGGGGGGGAPPTAEDGWVTAFGFSPDDLPAVLRLFQECGDILQWGTFGAAGAGAGGGGCNFAHLRFATREGAQRALLRSGSALRPGLIVGVKALDPRHRALIASSAGAGGGAAAGTPLAGQQRGGALGAAAARQQRPYRVVGGEGAAAALPQPTRSWAQKFSEFVLGA